MPNERRQTSQLAAFGIPKGSLMKHCATCKGPAPFFICRWNRCWCHIEQEALDMQNRGRDAHADPTARQAIANIMNPRKGKRP